MKIISVFFLINMFVFYNYSFAQEECTYIPHHEKTEEYTSQVASNRLFSSDEKETIMGKFKIEIFKSIVVNYSVIYHRFDCFNRNTGWERTKYERGDESSVTSTENKEAPFSAKVTFPNGNVFEAGKDIYFLYQGKGRNYRLKENGVFVSDDFFAPKFTFEQIILIISGSKISETDLTRLIKLLDTNLP